MALFENMSKSIIDDTEQLTCTIENAQNINKHTEYILRVQRGPNKENKWNVSRRYRDFAALHSILQQSGIELPLPPKKLIGNMQPSFIAERQIALQNYINEVLKHHILALSLQVRSFLDPNNYSTAFAEQALQTVSIALRGDGRYELKGPLADIGWRIRKHYFLVTDTESKSNCILSWQNYGPDRCLCDKDMQTAFKSLRNLSHPYIDQILGLHNLETGVYVVRRIHENGTLRDMLYGTEYSKSYLSKYGNPRVRKPLTCGQISHYGYQILQALKFLHEKGLPHGHLHPGNIAISNQRAVLLEIENVLVGCAGAHRPHLVQLRRGRRHGRTHPHALSAEAVDVYCFGRTLYEMTFATQLEQPYCEYYPDGLDEDLELVLRLCLSPPSCKEDTGGPSLEELLEQRLFARAHIRSLGAGAGAGAADRSHLKFPLALKEELKAVVTCFENRLKTDQKLERSARREVRIQEILNSEEEMRKQRRRAKKRDSVWKSSSSLAETETARSRSASTASSPTPTPTPPRHAISGDVVGTSMSSPASSASVSSPCQARSALNGVTSPSDTPSALNGVTSACDAPSPLNGATSPCNARSALLGAICSFDKNKLSRVTTR